MKKIVLLLCLLFIISSAEAALITYSGIDSGLFSLGPNSLSARSDFESALSGPLSEITFESLTEGTLRADPFTPVMIAPGVNANFFGDISSAPFQGVVSFLQSPITGFNTTPAGTNHLGLNPGGPNPTETSGLTMTFDRTINSWGAYLTGLDLEFQGVLHILFNDGTSQELIVPEGVGGGVQFYGFITDGRFSTINFDLQGVADTRDIFGFDDVVYTYAVPEPSAILLLASGLVCLCIFRKKQRT